MDGGMSNFIVVHAATLGRVEGGGKGIIATTHRQVNLDQICTIDIGMAPGAIRIRMSSGETFHVKETPELLSLGAKPEPVSKPTSEAKIVKPKKGQRW
jgi:hypothetical protein